MYGRHCSLAWLVLAGVAAACSASHATTASDAGSVPPPPHDGGTTVATVDGGAFQGTFHHPGVLVNGPQLALLRAQAGDAGLRAQALAQTKTQTDSEASGTPWASLTYVAQPPPSICCGSVSSPDLGCKAEQFDVEAAYTDALLWALTGDEAYAKQAVAIMNAYAAAQPTHYAPTASCTDATGATGLSSNTPVQSGWCGSVFPRAGEILRSYSGWAQADQDKFATMLRGLYLPNLLGGNLKDNGNYELSMADALIQIGVYLDDADTFNAGVALWRRRVPAYIYMSSDGTSPVTLSGEGAVWDATNFVDGLCQETCRPSDQLHHCQLGFAAMINAAETARIQGLDLYGEQSARIVAGLELEASYLNGAMTPDPGCVTSKGVPTAFSTFVNGAKPTQMWEIAYNHYANRAGTPLPQTLQVVQRVRPTTVDHDMDWETLTHADVGSVGLP
ncbi:MAG TPA: alginate lyase family protein [Polyangiaceae bacterium]